MFDWSGLYRVFLLMSTLLWNQDDSTMELTELAVVVGSLLF